MMHTRHARPTTTRWMWIAAVLLGTLALPAVAQAQIFQRPNENYRTPKRFALELRFGPYGPDVDDEFDGTQAPYLKTFGKGRPLMSQVELDYQFFTGFGSAAVGIAAGYFTDSGPAKTAQTMEPSGDDTRISLFPTALLLVYRADQLWQRWRIPLTAYGKVGLNYTFWNISDGNGDVAEGSSVGLTGRGRGGTRGWQAAVGVSLVLDFIDPGSARELDSDTGVNHTHAFFELAKYSASGLGQSGKLNVGDSTWVAGLMFEF
jgi:hypothetical protein